MNASSELWTIRKLDTHEVLYSSWIPVDNQTETRLECINKTSNLQYELVMMGMWEEPSFLEIQGPYGNRVFKGTYSASYNVSMLTLVDANSKWYLSQFYVNDWSRTIPSDWGEYSSQSPLQRSVYYFCCRFPGLSGMTAYEVQFLYQSGIVAYINGIEVYRDNLPLGMILPETEATSGYASAEFRGTIRNAFEISGSDCVLAVEIHPLDEEKVAFDAWLAVYDSSLPEEKGYPIPYSQIGINSIYYESYRAIADFDIHSGLEFPFHDGDYFYVEFSGSTAQVNMWLISIPDPYLGLSRFKFSAKNMFTEEWSPAEESRSLNPQESITETVQIGGYSTYNSGLYRFYISEYISYSCVATEIRPYVTYKELDLHYTVPEFEHSYKLANGTEVSITPSYWDRVTCLSIPALPTGLQFNKCSIIGIPTVPQAAKTYNVYVYDEYGTKRTTFLLQVVGKSNIPVGIIVGIIISFCIICILVVVIIMMLCPSRRRMVLHRKVCQLPIESTAEPVSKSSHMLLKKEGSVANNNRYMAVLVSPGDYGDYSHHSHHSTNTKPVISYEAPRPPRNPDAPQLKINDIGDSASSHHSTNTKPVNPYEAPRPPRNPDAPQLKISDIGDSASQSPALPCTDGTESNHTMELSGSQSCIVVLPSGDVVDLQTFESDERERILRDMHII